MSEISIKILGIGGQGVVLSSIILAHAAILDGFNATQTQRYGAEVRGGEVFADVKISKDEIYTPVIYEADYMIGLTYSTLAKYINALKDMGVLFINEDLIQEIPPSRKKIAKIYRVPASSIAAKIGNVRVANIVMLGAFLTLTGVVSEESLIKSLEINIREEHLEINKEAYFAGKKYVHDKGGL